MNLKKILSIVFVLVMMLTVCTVMSFAEENTSGVLDSGYCGADGDNLTWTLYKDGELVISGEGDMCDYDAFNVPWTEGYDDIINTVFVKNGVTSIGNNAFRGLFYAVDYNIADSVISVGEYSFGWTSFNHILNDSLQEIQIPQSVTYIEKKAFYSSYIERIVIPDNIVTIKESTFENCSELNTVIIPASVTFVENRAFTNCTEIDTVYYRGTEEEWNNITFGTGNGYLKTAENIVFNAVCHDYESNVVAPTCTEKGYTKYVCKICGDEYIDETSYTDMIAHQATNGQCSVCKKFIVEEYEEISLSVSLSTDSTVTWSLSNKNAEIVSTGSSKVSWGSYVNITASATIEGLAVGTSTLTASANGKVISTTEIEIVKHEHNYYIDYFVEPTCTESGYYVNSCSCGDSYNDGTDNYPALGHNYVAVVVTEATCTEDGLIVYTCECANSYDEVITATGHTYTTVVTAPTCTEKGYTTYSCDCGLTFVDDYVNATGHTYSKEVIAPTCTEKGYTIYSCACGFSDRLDYVDATGHTYSKEVIAPTCTEKGYTIYSCACGFSDRLDYVNATGHTAGNWVVVKKAEIGKKGLEQQKCTVCGVVVNEREIPALPAQTTKPIEKPTNKAGDVDGNGKITAADARLALRISAKLEKATELQTTVADMDKNGKITAADARKILRISAKLE